MCLLDWKVTSRERKRSVVLCWAAIVCLCWRIWCVRVYFSHFHSPRRFLSFFSSSSKWATHFCLVSAKRMADSVGLSTWISSSSSHAPSLCFESLRKLRIRHVLSFSMCQINRHTKKLCPALFWKFSFVFHFQNSKIVIQMISLVFLFQQL